jgi:DMSO/TMAO reductase YedYZ molybdopterin-dependent catalytic subunit
VRAWLLLLALATTPAQAQQRESLVSDRVLVSGEVKRELALSVDNLRALARKHGMVEKRGYAGVRLVDLLEEADIRRDGEGRISLVSLADERSGFRHVKWLSKIEVKRLPD